MGIVVALEDERGHAIEQVPDPTNLLHAVLPCIDDGSYQCLRFIDWYANTVFNRLQMEQLLVEWRRLDRLAYGRDATVLLSQIERLARRCKAEAHLYLKFYGD